MTTTDLIVIGAGPGGYRAAEHAARHGLHTTIFEHGHVGGTCLNAGCIPTKAYARNAEIMLTLRDAEDFGLSQLHYEFDFGRVFERKNQVVESLRGGVESLLAQPLVTLVRDRATFVDSHTVSDSQGNTYTAPHIIVATGSEARQLPLAACDGDKLMDAAQLLATPRLPRSLCIVGAGVIGMEFASILSAFGVEVTVVEYLKECLPMLDADIAKRLRKSMERRGVTFVMQAAVTAVTGEGVSYERRGKPGSIEAEKVLMAVGRTPRLSDDFAQAGFSYDRRGIAVDDNMQTTVSGIYAIGDVNGRQMLAHAAEMQALRAVNHIVGRTDDMRLDVMPAAIFTHPEAACVGPSEDQLREQTGGGICRKAYFRANGKACATGETEGMVKLMADTDGRLVGCHAYGAHAADIVQEASVLICRETTLDQLAAMTHIHPTLGEVLLAAAEQQ